MEVTGGAEEGFIREWTPCSHILNLIPPRIQTGIFSSELCLTCVDVVSEYIALGTNVGLVYWYDRKKGNIQRLRCEVSTICLRYSSGLLQTISSPVSSVAPIMPALYRKERQFFIISEKSVKVPDWICIYLGSVGTYYTFLYL